MRESGSRSKLAASLGVVAPTVSHSRLQTPRPELRPKSTTEVKPQKSRSRRQKQQAGEPPTNPRGAAQPPANDVVETFEEDWQFSDAFRAVPSWLISMTVHLVLLLILALCTWNLDKVEDGPIVMELADHPAEMSSALMDISIEDTQLDELADSLEAEDETVELEEFTLAPEIDESAELLTETQELPPVDLPEFRTEAEKQAAIDKKKTESAAEATAGSPNGQADGEGKYVEFFGTKAYGSRFVFVIDGSSSMMGSRWLRATHELIKTLNQFDENQEYLVLAYNTRTAIMLGMRWDNADLVTATEENKHNTKVWLGNRRPAGGTKPAGTMRYALNFKPDAIYFLSDGELMDNTMFLLKNWNKPKEDDSGMVRQVPIHTVLLGSQFGFNTMKTIADENNGIFTSVR